MIIIPSLIGTPYKEYTIVPYQRLGAECSQR